jgi:thiamine-phosphate pyrophosphorylase
MKSYLLTDPQYYSSDAKEFKINLEKNIIKNKPDIVGFRDKVSFDIESLVDVYMKSCHKLGISNCYINSYIELALKYNAKGVHLTSSQLDKIDYARGLGLDIIVSCHNDDEIKYAVTKQVKTITYSPIFNSPNKGEPKGIFELQRVVEKFDVNVIALGGIITAEHISELKKSRCFGFASIRYFV